MVAGVQSLHHLTLVDVSDSSHVSIQLVGFGTIEAEATLADRQQSIELMAVWVVFAPQNPLASWLVMRLLLFLPLGRFVAAQQTVLRHLFTLPTCLA